MTKRNPQVMCSPPRQALIVPERATALLITPRRASALPTRPTPTPVLIQLSPKKKEIILSDFELLKVQLIEETRREHEIYEHELASHIQQLPNKEIIMTNVMKKKRSKVALLIAAHNEELVLENTIRSAIKAGQHKKNIFVVDDNSSDTTSEIARKLIPSENVIKVGRSGKGLALMRGTEHFNLTKRYEWVHIADADGAFSSDYFKVLRSELDPANAAATGYIKSLPGGIISQCRVYEYAIGMELMRRFQNIFGVIPIIPGATSCFRSDVFERVDFNSGSMTEDFDVTVQIHREKMGKIQFIPEMTAFTQDPKDLDDYMKQVNRWNRGFMQVIRRHNLGMKLFAIDSYISYQLFVSFFYIINFALWIPFLVISSGNLALLAVIFVSDVIFTFGMVVAAAGASRRWDILGAFPHIYGMRWLNMALFVKAVVEVFILGKFKVSNGLWDTAGRRYKPTATPIAS